MKDFKENIIIISQYWYPDVNGDVIRLENFIKVLKEKFKITLLTALPHYPKGDRKGYKSKPIIFEESEGIRIIRTYIPSISHYGFKNRMILYISFTFTSLFSLPFLPRSKYIFAFSQRVFSTLSSIAIKIFKGGKIVTDFTDVWPEAIVNTDYMNINSFLFKFSRFLSKITFSVSYKTIVLTEPMKEMLIKNYNLNQDKIEVIPNIAKFNPLSNKKTIKRTLLYTGNLGTNYDFITLVKFAAKNKDWDVIIRGDGELYEDLSKLVKKLNLQNFKIIKEFLDKEKFLSLLEEAEYLVLPMKNCKFENASFPIKFVEYLSYAKPILALANGYVRDLIGKYKVGYSLNPGDYEGISKLVNCERFIKNEIFEENFKKLIDDMFSWEIFMDRTNRLFK